MRRRFWIPTAALLALGLVFYFAVYGFRFAGVLLFLAAGVVLAFGIVDALRGLPHRQVSNQKKYDRKRYMDRKASSKITFV